MSWLAHNTVDFGQCNYYKRSPSCCGVALFILRTTRATFRVTWEQVKQSVRVPLAYHSKTKCRRHKIRTLQLIRTQIRPTIVVSIALLNSSDCCASSNLTLSHSLCTWSTSCLILCCYRSTMPMETRIGSALL